MQELNTKSTHRISHLFLPLATVSAFLIAFINIEQLGRCNEIDQQCNNNSECIDFVKNAEIEKHIAETYSQQGDSKNGNDHYMIAARLYNSAYRIGANPEFLARTCYLVDKANPEENKCKSKECYVQLLVSHPEAPVVKDFEQQIDRSLVSCTRQEAKQNVPSVGWSKPPKPGFIGPIYLKDGEKPWSEYVAQVEAEHREQIKKKFPHHYRMIWAGKVLTGIGMLGVTGGGVAALMGLPMCAYGCVENSPVFELSNNLKNIGGVAIVGSGALAMSGLIIAIFASSAKQYSEYEKFTTPIYDHVGWIERAK